MRTIYGPVSSWRIGECYNVDPICRSPKVCSFSCTYCKFGSSGFVTVNRSEMVDPEEFSDDVSQLSVKQKRVPLRFSGSGEPTLARNLGDMVSKARMAGVNTTVVVTNSSLLHDPDVRRDLMDVDIVIAKLDSSEEREFAEINRPHPDITFSKVLSGLRSMRSSYKGSLRMQIMLMEANRRGLEGLGEITQELSPDVIYISTPTRSRSCEPLNRKVLLETARRLERFGSPVRVEEKK